MSFNLTAIFGHMGPFAMAIAATLGLMAIASLAVFFERLSAYGRSRRLSRRFAGEAKALLVSGDDGALLERAAENKSHLAQLVGAGLRTFLDSQNSGGRVSPVELTRRELLRKNDVLAADVRRGMSVLATVGSVAPFVGLLGTVVGIIDAFQGIAKEGSGGLGAVSLGIAEALVVTALGLVVAIPAVLAFNFLTTRGEALLLALDQARGEFLDFLEAQREHVFGAATATTTTARVNDLGASGASESDAAHAVVPLTRAVHGARASAPAHGAKSRLELAAQRARPAALEDANAVG